MTNHKVGTQEEWQAAREELLAGPDATPNRAGCLTPATALGTACVERFDRARVRFSVSR